jgi:DNA-binding LacI/PurR family transcriptional regulator
MATIDDVARAAGVSVSTVSYVLSGKRPISEPTRERVKRAIVELSYRPHAGARALASSRTNVIALIAPLRTGVDVNVIMQFVTGVVTRAREFEHDVLLLTQDDVGGIERVSNGSMVDAVVVMDVEAEDVRIPTLRSLRQPAVLIGLPGQTPGLSCVDLDFEAAGGLALSHLTALGHRHVGLIGPPPSVLARHTSYADRMLRGYHAQALADGIEALVEACESTSAGARSATRAVLERLPDVTAVVVHNESALPGVLSTLRTSGRRVPDDVSILAICPADVALSQSIAVTSIDIPAQQIGAAAVDMVMERLAGADAVRTHLFPPQVTVRESTRPPAGVAP